MFKRISHLFLTAIWVIGLFAVYVPRTVHAATPQGQLDQEQALFGSGYYGAALNQVLKQSFTAGRSGALTDVSVYGHLQNLPPPGDLVIQVTDSGGAVLASATVAGDSFVSDPYTDRWITASFSSPPTVSAGTQYVLVVSSSQRSFCDPFENCNGIYYIGMACWSPLCAVNYGSDPYPGGSLSVIDQYGNEIPFPFEDIAFRTYVEQTSIAQVDIDVVPGSATNIINLRSTSVPVAILSSDGFNAFTDVSRSSLRFGKTGNEPSFISCLKSGQDVNLDGRVDLICNFRVNLTGLVAGDTAATLKGSTVMGLPFEASSTVNVIKGPK